MTAVGISTRVRDTTTPVRQLVLMDAIRDADRELVEQTIKADADAHGGEINPNRVRDALTRGGQLVVSPRVLSAVYFALRRGRQIAHAGWTESTDLRSRNRHKPARLWRWIGT